jgi:surface antigen
MPSFRSILLAPIAAAIVAMPAIAAEALDPADEAFRAASFRQAWAGPIGVEQRWSNPVSGHGGSVRATRERIDPASHQPCREIQESLSIGAAPVAGYAVGCREGDGTWRIVQASAAEARAGTGTPADSIVPADVTPYVAPADISADGNGNADFSSLPPQVRIIVPGKTGTGTSR